MHTVSRTPTGDSVYTYVLVRCPPTWRLATVAKEVGQLIGFVQRVYRVALRSLMHTKVCIGLDIAYFQPLMYDFIMQQVIVYNMDARALAYLLHEGAKHPRAINELSA